MNRWFLLVILSLSTTAATATVSTASSIPPYLLLLKMYGIIFLCDL